MEEKDWADSYRKLMAEMVREVIDAKDGLDTKLGICSELRLGIKAGLLPVSKKGASTLMSMLTGLKDQLDAETEKLREIKKQTEQGVENGSIRLVRPEDEDDGKA